MIRPKAWVLLIAFSISTFMIMASPLQATAVTANDWKAGRIIDDEIFTAKDSMSVGQIQDFLNQKVGTGGYASIPGQCDNNGVLNAQPFSSVSRTEYGASRNPSNPKFTCLKDYYEVPKTEPGAGIPASNYGGAPIPAGAKSAAQLIWDAAQTYTISPKVLLIKIQTESAGPLTTDDWPFKSQYTYAMGAHCPDSGPNGAANCDTNYAGFSLQIRESAKLFRAYLDGMDQPWWGCTENGVKVQCPANRQGGIDPGASYKVPNATNYILWDVQQSGCGGSNIFIENKATAALYYYTPYQPNAVALSNLYGSQDDGCSAYGNRNFWRTFNDWFGRSTLDCRSNEVMYREVMRAYNYQNYRHFYSVYACEINALQGKMNYHYEGVAFYQVTADSPYAVVVHRLYNPTTYLHLWATTQEEIDSAIKYSGYRYEGVAFYAVKPSMPNHVLVHRLYNPSTYLHLWVTTQDEINSATQHSGFVYEGPAFYSAPK